MALRKDLNDLDANGKKGDWCFLNNDELIAIRFGDECFAGTTILPISDAAMPGKPHWRWNGSKEFPTLTPSILVHASHYSTGWHGFLTNGELITV